MVLIPLSQRSLNCVCIVAITALTVSGGCAHVSTSSSSRFDHQLQQLDFLADEDRARITDILQGRNDCIVSISRDSRHTQQLHVEVRTLSSDDSEVICTHYQWSGRYGTQFDDVTEEYRVGQPTAVAIFKCLYQQVSRGDCYRHCGGGGKQIASTISIKYCLLTIGSASGMITYTADSDFSDMAFVVIGKETEELEGKTPIGGEELFPRLTPEHVSSVSQYIISAVRFFDEACSMYMRFPKS